MSFDVVAKPVELVFIDAGVPNLDQLLGGLRDGMEAVLLSAHGDPVLQIRDALSERPGLDAIHIVAHGEEGRLAFSGGSLSGGNIEEYADALREVGAALSADGDILLWSCDTGRGGIGQSFVDALAWATGADVAASDDLTGAAFLGGNWQLEVISGVVDAGSLLTDAAAAAYDQVLVPTAPAAPTPPDLSAASDSGTSSTDNLTNATSLTFTGTAQADSTVRLLIDGEDTGVSSASDGSGTYSLTYDASGLTDSAYDFTTTATDGEGNTGAASAVTTVTVDRTALAPVPDLHVGSDGGVIGDGITADTTPTFVGTGAEAGAIVVVYAGSDEVASTTVADDGTWTVTPDAPFAAGSYAITTRQTDVAGNLSESSDPFALKVMTQAPLVFAQPVGVTENSPLGSFVTQVGVIDLDIDDQHSFALVDKVGTEEDESDVPFSIDENGEITVSGLVDYEARQSYTLRVRVTDSGGLSTEQDLTVRVNDVAVNDFFFGTDGDDSIVFPGASGFDWVDGGSGTDELVVTADRMLVVGSAYLGDYLAFSLDIDRVGGYEQFLFAREIETLDLTAREIRLYGDLAHTAIGGDAIVLNGTTAGDYFDASGITSTHSILVRSSAGSDVIIGSSGFDTVDYSASATGVTLSLASGNGWYGDAAGDLLSGIERLIGSEHADSLKGDSRANVLEGGGGDDRFDGGAGADILLGGSGNDTAFYSNSNEGVTVDLHSGVGTSGHAEGDRLSDIENVSGSGHGDTLRGDGNANRLEGAAGDDILEGRGGADSLVGGAGIDTADYSGSIGRVTVSLMSGTGWYGHAAGDTLDSVENAIGSVFNDSLKGTTGANRLDGGAGDDTLDGQSGDDVLVGGAGNDRLTGGGGNDIFVFDDGVGDDTITDFVAGAGTPDVIDLYANSVLNSFADVLGRSSQSGLDTVIDLGGGDLLTLLGVTRTSLHQDDFTF